MLKLTLLGAPQIMLNGRLLNILSGKRARALLIYLAVERRTINRKGLATFFWPTVRTREAQKNLSELLPLLRRTVGPYLTISRQTIAFAQTQAYWLDVEEFCAVLEQVGPETPAAALHTALNLYHDPFLEGFQLEDAPLFEEWRLAQQERLHTLALNGFDRLAEYYSAQGAYEAGLAATQRALALEPAHERSHRQRMYLLSARGQPSAALAQYALCQQILRNTLGITPDIKTTALAEQIRHTCEEKGDSPANEPQAHPDHSASLHVAVPTPRHNLPRQLTQFWGREIELTVISRELLAADCQWLTLAGEGGIGKTRLALAVGEALVPKFRDGVWFISLANFGPGDNWADYIANAIGAGLQLTFWGVEPLMQQLIARLRDQQLLLILDDFDQLVSGRAFIPALLQATKAIKVLATARQRLDFTEERLFTLDGLSVPGRKEGELLFPQLMSHGSVALFVQRASQVKHNFTLNAENWPAIAQICHLLEGWPLAIELAATLVERYSCAQIAEEIQHDYANLATTLQDLPMRQQSIQAIFASSWHLLTRAEAQLLAQCSVFRGGFTHEAAATIAQATATLLRGLEEKFLLRQTKPQRFVMHELLRQYAAQQLAVAPALLQQTYEQHASFFAQFLYMKEETFRRDIRALQAVQEELDNLQASWHWAAKQANLNLLFKMLKPLASFYSLTGLYSEAATTFAHTFEHLQPQLQQADQTTPFLQHLLAQLLLEQADFWIKLAQMEQAESLIAEAQQFVPRLIDPLLKASTYQQLKKVAWARKDYALHRATYQTVLTLAQTAGLQSVEAHALSNLGMNCDLQGDYPQAIVYYQAALTLAKQNEHLRQINIIYNNLGVSYGMLGDFAQTLHYYTQSLQLSRQLGDQEGIAFAYLNLGTILNKLGAWPQAHMHLEQAETRFHLLKERRLLAKTQINLSLVAYHLEEDKRADQYVQQALTLARKNHFRAVEAEALTALGQILLDRQKLAEAMRVLHQAQQVWQALLRAPMVIFTKASLAYLCFLQGQRFMAQQLVEEILVSPYCEQANVLQAPNFVFLTCYRILAAQQDARAVEILQRASQMLQKQTATIQEEELRHTFLTQVATNRAIMRLAARHT